MDIDMDREDDMANDEALTWWGADMANDEALT